MDKIINKIPRPLRVFAAATVVLPSLLFPARAEASPCKKIDAETPLQVVQALGDHILSVGFNDVAAKYAPENVIPSGPIYCP